MITNDINKALFEKKVEAINPKYIKLYPAKNLSLEKMIFVKLICLITNLMGLIK